MLHFKNQPKFSGFKVDQKDNEKCLAIMPKIEALLTQELFKGKDVNVEFYNERTSSLISFVEVDGKKYVLKVYLSSSFEDGEAKFLRVWESAGVSVPHVYDEGRIGEYQYILMDFVDAKVLIEEIKQYTMDRDLLNELGRTLALMHAPKAGGYGRIIKGKPQYREFKEWLFSSNIQEKVEFTKENNLLTDKHGSLTYVFDVLNEYSEKYTKSSYCHFDYDTTNILATKPITVIDPSPMLNLGIIDFGRSIVLLCSRNNLANVDEELKKGYFSGNVPYDANALHAAIILNAYLKFPYWYKKEKKKAIENVRQYLVQINLPIHKITP